jgi:hypothetical protein
MDHTTHDPAGTKHPSSTGANTVAVVAGVVGGAALFVGVMAWYFWMAGQQAPPMPGTPVGIKSGGDENLVMETDMLDIVPLSELHLNVKSGKAEGVETPKESGLTAELDDKGVKIAASKDAKEGPVQIKIKGAKGKEAVVTVNVKKK